MKKNTASTKDPKPLPKLPDYVQYALTVPQSVLFADLSLQGNTRKVFKNAMGIDYEPEYIIIDKGGTMSWNYTADKQLESSLRKSNTLLAGIQQFINTMARTTRHLDKISKILSVDGTRRDNINDIFDDITLYWDAYTTQMTSLFTFWNIENMLLNYLSQQLKEKISDKQAKEILTEAFLPNELSYFAYERRQLGRIAKRFNYKSTITKGVKQETNDMLTALTAHGHFFGFLLTPFNLGNPPSARELIDRLENKDYSNEPPKLPIVNSNSPTNSPELNTAMDLAHQLAFWKTERLDILSLADARVSSLYNSIARRLRLELSSLFALTSNEILESLKRNQVIIDAAILKERQKGYCLMLHKGKINFYKPSSDKNNSTVTKRNKRLKGTPASKGKVRGSVRIINSLKDLPTLKKGEILVTKMTRPEHGIALDRAAAFVTDEGGLLSHAAIVAREMKKPCITGTKNATRILRNGDFVEVDATLGIVTILRKP